MADLVAADVTYTILNQRRTAGSKNHNRVRLAFGDGADTVPSGGIPLSKGKLGCPVVIESLVIVDQGTSGYVFQYDQSAEKLVVMHSDATTAADHAHDFLVKGGTAAASTDAINIKSVIIGKEAATDATSVAADTATKGGVLLAGTLAIAAGTLDEANAVAIVAQTIEVEVIGW